MALPWLTPILTCSKWEIHTLSLRLVLPRDASHLFVLSYYMNFLFSQEGLSPVLESASVLLKVGHFKHLSCFYFILFICN